MKLISLTSHILPLSPNGSPPRDFTLIPRGTLETVYGDFEWTDRSGRAVTEMWGRLNRRFMWDYQHLSDKPMASVHDRRSAGNAQPLADANGFHLRDQFWTPDADRYIRQKEYLYFSPVIGVDEKTREIIAVLKASLTNDPATLGCAPLLLSVSEDDQIEELTAMAAPSSETPTESHAPSSETPGESHRLAAAEEAAASEAVKPGPVSHNPDDYPKDESVDWDGPAAEKGVWEWAGETADGKPNFRKARLMFGVVVGKGDTKGDFKLIHHAIKDGKPVTVRGGVRAAMNAIQDARGGVDMPSEYVAGVKLHLAAEAHRFGDKAPWETERSTSLSTTGGPSAAIALIAQPKAIAHPHGSPAKHEVSSVLVRRLSDGHTLWGRRHDSKRYTTPGGLLRKDERPIDGAVRELKEETGIDVTPHSLAYLGTLRTTTETGAPIDVHGYHLTLPDHVVACADKDPDREVSSWEYLACHPLSEMHAPRNALSVLTLNPFHKDELSKKTEISPMALTTNHQKAYALVKELSALLPSIAADQAAVNSIKSLSDSLAAAGATGEGYDVEVALSVLPTVMEITSSKTAEGLNGKLYALSDASKVAPVALQLSTEQACLIEIERGIKRGAISPSERKVYADRVAARKLSLSDCQARANGPVLYSVPNQEPAPQGANSATVSLTAPAQTGTLLNAAPPEGLKPAQKVELSAQHEALLAAAERESGFKLPREKVAQTIAQMSRKGEPVRVENPGN